MSRADLILKLTVGKDKRTVEPVETGGRISYFFRTYSANLKKILPINLIYAAIFALPLVFSFMVLPMLVSNYVYSGKNFIGNFGIGFPNIADSYIDAVNYLHYIRRILVFPCMIGSAFIAFFGLSGLFHCSRGLMWGEKVKIKSFFRGIKKLWKPFIVLDCVFSIVLAAFLYGLDWHTCLLNTTGATWASYLVSIIVGIVAALTVILLMITLPSIACYDFKLVDHLKNSVLFICVMPIQSVFVAAFTVGLLAISLVSPYISMVIGFLLIMSGFMFFTMMWTTYGQYLFDNYICTQVDKDGNRREVKIQKKTKNNTTEYTASKGNSRKAEKVKNNNYNTQTTSNNSNNQKKKKPQNTYSSSYKRKPSNNKKK